MGKYGKPNEVKIDPLAYNICLLGEPKIGKTTLVKEVCEKLAGKDGYIFLELAGERGADAIQGIIYENVDEWSELEDIVEDIVDNKTTDYSDLKVICMDTYDGWIKLAQEEAIRIWNKENPEKRANSIDSSWNGFQKGQIKAFDFMFDIITRLDKVGVRVFIIGHVKNKNETDVASGMTFKTLTSDVETVYFNLLKKKMHFLGLAYYDRTIISEKTGKKNIVTKKDEMVNKLSDQTRKIKFRDDNVAVDSGSRFAEIVDEIDFGADEFIKALTEAIKAEQSKSNKSFEDTKVDQEKQEAEKLKEIAKKEEENRKEKELKGLISQVTDFIKDNVSDKEKIKPILDKSKELGYVNPTKVDNLKDAKTLLNLCK